MDKAKDTSINKESKPDNPNTGKLQFINKYFVLNVIGIIGFFSIWHFAVASGLVQDKYLAKPVNIFITLFDKFTNIDPDGATLFAHMKSSFTIAFTGLLIALAVGIPLGLLMGWYKPVDKFVRPVFELIRPISPIAWIPLTILWLGIGLKAKASIIFFSAFVPCVINSYTGIKLTNPVFINVAKTCGASNFRIFRKVGIPSALPLVFAGIRIALGNAWATLVAAELLASNVGLGYMILQGRQFARPDIIVVGMLTIGLIGALMSFVLVKFEERLVKGRIRK